MKIDWEDESSQQREQRRLELIENAAQIFRHKGFKATKLDEIAALMQKGKTALYYYFQNKKSIFAAVIEWEISRIYQQIEDYTLAGPSLEALRSGLAADAADTADTADVQCVAALLRYVEKVVEIGDTLLRQQKRVFAEYAAFQKLIQSVIKAFKEQNVALLTALLQHGQRQQQISLEQKDISPAAYAIFRICFTYYSDIMQGIDFQIGAADLQNIVLLLLHAQREP